MPGKPAARNNDMHLCPKPITPPPVTPAVHGPGMIQASGSSKVFINQLPAAVVGDTCICIPEPGNTIQQGSSTVYFGSQQAARQLDPTSHFAGGTIQTGSPNVYIGG